MDNIIEYLGKKPRVPDSSYVSRWAFVLGDVVLGENVSIFENVVIKGDLGTIYIGNNTNVQSGTTIHAVGDEGCKIGNHVTIGHNSTVHGCTLEDFVTVGLGSTIMADTIVGKYSFVGAQSFLPQGKRIPGKKLVIGHPARVVRDLSSEEIDEIKRISDFYVQKGKKYKESGL
ncbi:MAG: gamma carbonic anhydrase family protein [Promethearchaeota archaeon]